MFMLAKIRDINLMTGTQNKLETNSNALQYGNKMEYSR